jgi:hypothetical protein
MIATSPRVLPSPKNFQTQLLDENGKQCKRAKGMLYENFSI